MKRYDLVYGEADCRDGSMEESDTGEFVRYEDVEAVLSEAIETISFVGGCLRDGTTAAKEVENLLMKLQKLQQGGGE